MQLNVNAKKQNQQPSKTITIVDGEYVYSVALLKVEGGPVLDVHQTAINNTFCQSVRSGVSFACREICFLETRNVVFHGCEIEIPPISGGAIASFGIRTDKERFGFVPPTPLFDRWTVSESQIGKGIMKQGAGNSYPIKSLGLLSRHSPREHDFDVTIALEDIVDFV